MDQTKFINTYIANIAERLKTAVMDNISLSTQLSIANETIAELTAKLEEFSKTDETPDEADVLPLSDYK